MGACTCVCWDPAHVGAMLFVCMLPVSPSLAICVFYSTQPKGWLCRKCSCHGCPAVGDVARHGNILAFLVAVCGLPTICLHAAAYLLSPLAPFRLLHKRAFGWAVGTSRLRFVVTFYFCWRGCRSRLVSVA